MMHQINCYVLEFKAALQNMPSNDYKIVIHANKTPTGITILFLILCYLIKKIISKVKILDVLTLLLLMKWR